MNEDSPKESQVLAKVVLQVWDVLLNMAPFEARNY